MLTLKQIHALPEGFLAMESPTRLHTLLQQPTLLHLKGRREQPLFISILLHGNEDTGFYALQRLLRKYQNLKLPRSLSIFFGNTLAAEKDLRRLDGQPDYNRTWPGGDLPESPETRLMQQITETIAARSPFASVDVHNNTGRNPHYGCINTLEPAFLHLAALFSRTVIFFENPKGVQSMAMAEHCPSVTLECGKSHSQHGIDHATEYLDAVLNLAEIPTHPVASHDVDVFHTIVRVTIPNHLSFSYEDAEADIHLSPEIERFNFSELAPGTPLATVNARCSIPPMFHAWDDQQKDQAPNIFRLKGNCIELAQTLMPAMITLDEKVIRQDCLCYLMERISV
ncbi:MAG: M14 family metallopeptidase [bacterium]